MLQHFAAVLKGNFLKKLKTTDLRYAVTGANA